MEKIKIGIICPSDIALRRFMPAISKCDGFKYMGLAVADKDEWDGELTDEIRASNMSRAQSFVDGYGGKIYGSYHEIVSSPDIDAVYLPLPPALHYRWGRLALENGKHLFVEKPSTISSELTHELTALASAGNLALHENYMFQYHSQIDYIRKMISDGMIGDLRLLRIAFGFPKRAANDFRYNKALGGGALLDCGGYTIKLASMFLGEKARITASQLNYTQDAEVDIYGSATMVNENGLTAQLAFGMDNSYKCDLEVWGSKGHIFAGRILTAPAGFEPTIEYKSGNDPVQQIKLEADDTFMKSIQHFEKCIRDEQIRKENYELINKQSELVDVIKNETI